MNHIYRLVWSQLSNAWVAVAETARGRGKTSRRKLVLVALSLSGTAVQAAPLGGQVSAGSGSISSAGTTTTITQSSQNLSLNWNSFNIGRQETVNFVQPSASAIAVNRITDTNGTQILGQLNANGQVYLINPNGILFGSGAQVNVGGLVASTLGISDAALSGAARSFAGTGTGSIVNQGTINAANGGYVAFLGNAVSNQGTINAPLGAVALGAGSAVTLTFDGNSLVKMQVDQSTLNNLAENRDLIKADGGMVIMNAGAKDALLASVVNNTGVIQAHTVENRNGTITLLGGMAAGQVNVGGTLDASAPNGGNGGFIETSAARVKIASDAGVTTRAPGGKSGTWLIDPVDYTIAASGGDQTGAQLSAALSGGNVTIQSANGTSGTAGNVNVNDTVSWSANTLTLNAQNNININSAMTATGSAGLALQYGQGAVAAGNTSTNMVNAPVNLATGTSFSTKLGSDGTTINYIVINSLGAQGDATAAPATASLQGMAATSNLAKNYVLGSNIDATATSGWNSNTGFTPIGNSTTNFTGNFDGLGHTISNLTSNRPTVGGIGMFGIVNGTAVIRNIGLVNVSMTGHDSVGGLIGANFGNTVSNSYATGAVSAGSATPGTIGGLVGFNSGAIRNSYATSSVNVAYSNNSYIGGLVGNNSGSINNSYATGAINVVDSSFYIGGLIGYNTGTISNSHATGTINRSTATDGINYTGGLVGYSGSGTISNSYATVAVIGGSRSSDLGGLVGLMFNGAISNSYSTGAVNGHNSVGGLVGNSQGGPISNSYATGAVSNDSSGSYAGGLVGSITSTNAAASITNSYATGAVSGSSNGIGGLVGYTNSATAANSYWNTATSGQSASAGGLGTGLTTAQMQQQSNFGSWDFSNTWISYSGQTAPLLRSFMTPLMVTANNVTKTYDSYAYSSGSVSFSSSNNLIGYVLGSVSYSGTSQGATNVGSYVITPGGLYSNQQGYIISYANGTLTVNPASLSVTGVTASNKTYDAGTAAALSGTAAVAALGSDVITVSGTGVGTFADKNVGNGKAVTVTGYTLSGAAAGNYTIVQPTGLTANITPASLAVTGVTANNKTYDTSAAATLAGTATVTALGSDVVSLGGTGVGTFANKNVGNGKAVTISGYTLSGTDASNYTLVQPTGLTANITPASLAVTGVTASNKTYDAGTGATLLGTAAVTALGNDVVSLGGTGMGTFADKNVGNGKTVTVSGYTLSGTDAGNYTIVQPTGLTANITPASLAITGLTAGNKVYDAGTAAALAGTAAVTALGSDAVSLGGTGVGTFANKNVGNGKTVTVSGYTLSGADAGNYNLAAPANLTANITPAALTVSGITANNKTYDGTTSATVNTAGATLSPVIGTDQVTLHSTGAFADAAVGTGKTVNLSNSLGGADGGNYTLGGQATTLANISPAPVAVANPDSAALPQTPLPQQVRNTIADAQSPLLASLQPAPQLPLQLPPPAIALHQDDGGGDKSSELPASRPVNIQPGIPSLAPTLKILDAGVKLPPASIADNRN
ncbi:YDG domain-containing protein [Herbaspirillum sp.]|uniref:YDG domain-containing protein n=1 Tax=Herbaspirillum sp. TaxID=1890675 RepID=UPI001B0B87A8|nr:YDG domain-containing protein [Herbaspirillum sp.]MBO9535701.1 filamentous hemagglutinin N-terminal domain-containing protein [Herbaspirillum sp.]